MAAPVGLTSARPAYSAANGRAKFPDWLLSKQIRVNKKGLPNSTRTVRLARVCQTNVERWPDRNPTNAAADLGDNRFRAHSQMEVPALDPLACGSGRQCPTADDNMLCASHQYSPDLQQQTAGTRTSSARPASGWGPEMRFHRDWQGLTNSPTGSAEQPAHTARTKGARCAFCTRHTNCLVLL
jgi:hypothetical protein